MQKFIIKVIGIFTLLVIFSFSIDYAISSGLRKMEDYRFQTWTDIESSKINADILIMGNSRAFSHYSPLIIDSVLHTNSYNLGIGGHPLNIQLLRYNMYLEHNILPKVIIQNVDFFTLQMSKIGHQREQVFPYIKDTVLRNNLTNLGFSWAEIYLPLYRYFGYQMVIKNGIFEYFHIHHYNNQPSNKGYRPETSNWDPITLNKLESIESTPNPEAVTLFENFLSDCNHKNIKVVLVYTPLYYKAREKLLNKDKLSLLFRGLSKKYSVPYLDYSNDTICKDSTYFSIAIHLNKKGAEIFSTQLANDLKSILNCRNSIGK